jgi:hypothetical protein
VIFIFQQSNTRATRERHSGRAHSLDECKRDLASGDHGKARSPIVGYLKLPLKTRSKRVLNTIASITFLKHCKCFRPALFCYVSPLPTRLIPAALRAIRDVLREMPMVRCGGRFCQSRYRYRQSVQYRTMIYSLISWYRIAFAL